MATGDYPNSGILSRNDKKTEETHAGYTGSAEIGNVEYWIDAWVKERKSDGRSFFSLRFKPKPVNDEYNQTAPSDQQPKPDGDIPF